ncbi:LOW QUALITY PROTEIN: uncharacterized protein C7orf31 homolog [Dendronephthya gigantea]|uniref:LOW QUALITY PROTEIN: uncharacterized protein C7orf31 homolog n=1 Tax=Dendronephthya gigantea TaxID=151771 RepID=UPI00106AFA7F|nr:LOW QUALITY PROTEIN: uncharacterized protein C7orf31 homolog [Dendronephthya gigantea]
MPFNVEYMTPYQKYLYKERSPLDRTSQTYNSSVFQSAPNAGGVVFVSNAATNHGNNHDENIKAPWGRSRSYAGDGPIYLPTEHRPKCEPPPVLQRTHKHFGSGGSLFPHPRGYPFVQYYDLTQLKRSDVRSSDELIPRPSTSQLHDKQIKVDFPQEHPLSSHMSRQEMFPKFEVPTVDPLSNEDDPGATVEETSLPQLVPVPNPTVVVQKIMGNFARREIFTPQAGAVRRPLTMGHRKIERLKIENPWFSQHEVMTEFNKQHPTVIPKIDLNIQKKKQPNWLVKSVE